MHERICNCPAAAVMRPAQWTRLLFAVSICLLLQPASGTGQTSQRLSLQASGLFADLAGDNFFAIEAGLGLELQARYTPGTLSFGGGVQFSHHGDSEAKSDGHEGYINLTGIFVEPRYGFFIGSPRVAPYLAARLGFARLHLHNDFSTGETLTWTSYGVTVNGGGGLLFRLSSRANLDLGATAGFTNYRASEGELDGAPFPVELGSGTNLVMRMGIAVGLGR